MAKRKRSEDEGRAKLLDAWTPPGGAGAPIGCLATSFTFDAPFFEEECLARFLALETDPVESSAAYVIEQAEALQLAYAGVVIDRRSVAEERSLGWDLMSVSVRGGAMHAKVSLLLWSNAARLIVGSANLTEGAYRANLEVFGVLDFRDGEGDSPIVLDNAVSFLRRLLRNTVEQGPVEARARDFLDTVQRRCRGWGAERRGDRTGFISSGLGGESGSVLGQLRQEYWGGSLGVPTCAVVVSPFFDVEVAPAFDALRGILNQRGSDNQVELWVSAQQEADGCWRVDGPESLREQMSRDDFFVYPLQLTSESEIRRLHAKALWLENEKQATYLLGSSNFTRPGLGLKASHNNIEANLVFSSQERKGRRALDAAFPPSDDEEISVDEARFLVPVTDEDPAGQDTLLVAVPPAFVEATFRAVGGSHVVELRLAADELPRRWDVALVSGRELFSSALHDAYGRPADVSLPWLEGAPPSVLRVRWGDAELNNSGCLAVNVDDHSSLPPPDALRELSLESLLAILSMSKPLHEAIEAEAKRRSEKSPDSLAPHLDPLRRFKNDAFLLQRTRRFAHALLRLKEKLEAPVYTETQLAFRLRGPVGPMALARAIEKESTSDGERAFLLCEIALSLQRLEPMRVPGSLSAKRFREQVGECLVEVMTMARSSSKSAPGDLQAYVKRALKEVMQ